MKTKHKELSTMIPMLRTISEDCITFPSIITYEQVMGLRDAFSNSVYSTGDRF